VTANTYTGGTITALTDATGCPGVLCGKNSEAAGLLNCCVTGTTNCGGTCKTTGTYTTNDGGCTGECYKAYTQLRNQCNTVIQTAYGTYENTSCWKPCRPYKTVCSIYEDTETYFTYDDYACWQVCKAKNAKYYYWWMEFNARRCACC
ncbi:MAG: hypothetical protein LBU42_01810, partial [Prevotellaceae bacterium]|nr:hypothetical protein [Prevotellaceae bacterium]